MRPHGLQGPARTRDERGGVHGLGVLGRARERGVRERGGGGEGLGVPEPLGLGGQFGVLAGQRGDGLDLFEAEAQQIGLLGAFPGPGGDLVQLGGDGPQPPVRLAVGRERHRDGLARVPVERAALPGGLEQALLVGLAVDGDEFVRELGEQPDGHGAPAEVGPGAPLGRDGTADEQDPLVQLGPGLLGAHGGGRARGHADPPLDHGRGRADPYERRVGPSAEQQPQTGHDHGLARTGLTGHRGEAGRQLDHSVVDDPERPYPHLLQHAPDHTRFPWSDATSPRP